LAAAVVALDPSFDDEQFLITYQSHCHIVAATMRRTYRRSREDEEDLAQILAMKLLTIPPRVAQLFASLPRTSRYIFAAQTKSGHINAGSYRQQHQKVLRSLEQADENIGYFVVYSLRHTAITRSPWTAWMRRISSIGLDTGASSRP
jgi:hypothetical protein